MKREREKEVVLALRGTVIDAPELTSLRVLDDAIVGIDAAGRVAFCEADHKEGITAGQAISLKDGTTVLLSESCIVRSLPDRGFICPGFVDTHTHAPQFSFAGVRLAGFEPSRFANVRTTHC